MTCKFCGGYVEWKGPLTALTHTECEGCGCVDCQEEDWDIDADPDHDSHDETTYNEHP